MARKSEAEGRADLPVSQDAPERGSPSRSTSETSNATGKSQRNRPIEAAAGQETRAPKAGAIGGMIFCESQIKNDVRDSWNSSLRFD
jgi:hypothetical protein